MTSPDVTFVFSGQGSQTAGMLDNATDASPLARDLLARADDRLGVPLSEYMRVGPSEALLDTTIAQPALLTMGVLHARLLQRRGIVPRLLIGHSVGQFAALVTAGALEFESAVDLVGQRARIMASAMPQEGGAMAAILGPDRDAVYAACRASAEAGAVSVACHNAPDQTVIAGSRSAVDAAADRLEDVGMSVVVLAVSVAAHCPLLADAIEPFESVVASCPIRQPEIVVIDTVTARPLANAAAVRQSIVRQFTAPVLFEESVRLARSLGTQLFVQCGPGDTLVKCVRRQFTDAPCLTFRDALAGAAVA